MVTSKPIVRSPREHLDLWLGWIRDLVELHIRRFERRHHEPASGPLHTFVSKGEMQGILSGEDAESAGDRDELRARAEAIDGASAAGDDIALPLALLRERLDLDPFAVRLLVAVAAPELSVDLHRAYRHAYADFTRRHGSVLFFEELLDGAGAPPGAVRSLLAPGGVLRRLGLVYVRRPIDGEEPEPSPTDTDVRAASRLVSYLLEGDRSPALLPPSAELRSVGGGSALRMDEDKAREIIDSVRWCHRRQDGTRLVLAGAAGSGRRTLVQQACGALVSLDLGRLEAASTGSARDAWLWALREARIRDAALFVDGLEQAAGGGHPTPAIGTMLELLCMEPGTVCVGVERLAGNPGALLRARPGKLVTVEVPFPTLEEQRAVWIDAIPADVALAPDVQVDDIVARYTLSGGSIVAAASNAVARVRARGGADVRLERVDLLEAAREQLTHRLGDLATRVPTPFTWGDLVVDEKLYDRLQEVLSFYRQRSKLLGEWGFGRLLAYGRGLSVLFSGPPGTGKTMAAMVMARDLGLEIFQVDLSRVVDKYIGETEKKLAGVFDEAGRGQAILLFDEADSLFAQRTEVRTSTDRYANVGVNFLLQRMETYEGISILTTNRALSIDEAFKRRIRFKVEFPFPEPEVRTTLWYAMLPREAQTGADIDYEDLGSEFELSGADIKNAILKAATRAAEQGLPIDHKLLCWGAGEVCRERGTVYRALTDD